MKDVSIYVVTTMVVIMFIVSYTIILIYQFYRYATNMDDELPQVESRLSASVLKAPKLINSTEYKMIKNEIRTYTDRLDPAKYFDDEDFREITQFNTREVLNAVGIAIGDISKMYLSTPV